MTPALRAWFSRPGAETSAWYRPLADPVGGRALRLLQADPADPWTVAALTADRPPRRTGGWASPLFAGAAA
ncbi:hypothetical protein ACFYWX_15680 [Streptomyces sp. NPDC002888]|uniref:hypothetical protein n=1 Tax=Streptomyces sp. NPDC002888 TaxID=3364668 RepID=UPI0036C83D79